MSAIRSTLPFDIEGNNPAAVVKGDPIDERNQWRLDVFAADSRQFFLHSLGVVDAFDAHLIVDSENNHTATGVGEGDYFLRNSFGVRKLYFQLKKRIFAAANQSQQFSPGGLRRGR
jgi:hypothetical protein